VSLTPELAARRNERQLTLIFIAAAHIRLPGRQPLGFLGASLLKTTPK
jgi:hypothetical protein